MIKRVIFLGLFASIVVVAGSGCASDTEDDEEIAQSNEMTLRCYGKIKAKPYSDAWRDQLKKCIAESQKHHDQKSGGYNSGGSASCNVTVKCTSGGCTCGSGPNQGKACDGSTISSPNACSVLCTGC